MSQNSPILGLPYIQAAQAQKHVTHNEALRVLDALVQLAVSDDDRTAPPASPTEGDRHIVAAGATGAWAGQDGAIAIYETGTWRFEAPRAGTRAWVLGAQDLSVFDGAAWTRPLGNFDNVARFGLGATASAQTPFVVRADAALWDAAPTAQGGSGGVIQSMNREDPTKDAGLALQTDYTTRALVGFFGSEALRIATSPDGVGFSDALRIDPVTGIAAQPQRPKFKALTNYDNYLPVGQWTQVGINSIEFDPLGTFDPVLNRFTAPHEGTYVLGANALHATDSSTNTRLFIRLIKNGGSAILGASTGLNGGSQHDQLSGAQTTVLTTLAAGDTVTFEARAQNNPAYLAANQTVLWGYMLP